MEKQGLSGGATIAIGVTLLLIGVTLLVCGGTCMCALVL